MGTEDQKKIKGIEISNVRKMDKSKITQPKSIYERVSYTIIMGIFHVQLRKVKEAESMKELNQSEL